MKIAHTLFADEIRQIARLATLTGESNEAKPLTRYRQCMESLANLDMPLLERYQCGMEASFWLVIASVLGKIDPNQADKQLHALAVSLELKVGVLYRLAISSRECALLGRRIDIMSVVNPPIQDGYTVKEIAGLFGNISIARARAIAKSSQWPNLNLDDHLAVYPKVLVEMEMRRRVNSKQVNGYRK